MPAFQLDIVDGPNNTVIYDPVTQSVVTQANAFTLGAILTPGGGAPAQTAPAYLSIAILGALGQSIASPPAAVTVTVNGIVYTAAAFALGTPSIPSHGVFPTSYMQIGFNFATATRINAYDVALAPGGWTANPAGGAFVMPFDIVVSGFGNQLLHFDLYSQEVRQNGNSASFAPFSHDATGAALRRWPRMRARFPTRERGPGAGLRLPGGSGAAGNSCRQPSSKRCDKGVTSRAEPAPRGIPARRIRATVTRRESVA